MSYRFSIVNNTGRTVVAPDTNLLYSESQQAVVYIDSIGSVYLIDIGNTGNGPKTWGIKVVSGEQTENWYYEGGGSPVLTLNGDGTFLFGTPGDTIGWAIGGPMGVPAIVPANHRLFIRAFTDATNQQRVMMTFDGGGESFVRYGSGELNKEFINDIIVTPHSKSDDVLVYISIQNSTDNGTHWRQSTYGQLGTPAVNTYRANILVSEDAEDNDLNDCTVILQWWHK